MAENTSPRDREREVLELLEELLDCPDAERAAFLQRVCANDGALRERLLELLPLHSDLGPAPWTAWVDHERLGGAAVHEFGVQPGERVGSYEILRSIAAGGMGRVFEARQDNPSRRVALKMLRVELESEEMERRFHYESEVLARLRHPGIATIFEAGIHSHTVGNEQHDVPWIALEYVAEARSIDAFVADEGLDLRARLNLFLQVLDAVQHGHQRGVIHRDLKPANILVDTNGHAKLIDFGVALATQENENRLHDVTLHGELVGTVRYMSPEQAEGSNADLDVCSDVYSLGVVLYELLCDRHPHDLEGKSLTEAVRTVAGEEPLRPSLAKHTFDRDLEAILLRALEREKTRRYPSASAFAEDVRAFLEGRPITARPPGPGRYLRLFARRNPLTVGAIALAIVALTAATIVSVRFGLREGAARREAEELQEGLLDQTLALHMGFAPKLAQLEGSLEVRRSMIQEAIDSLELLEDRAGRDGEVQQRLAAAYRSLGDVLGNPTRDNLGDLQGAEDCYRHSLEILESLDGEGLSEATERGVLLNATLTRVRLAQLASYAGRPEDALPYFEEFLEVAAIPGVSDAQELRFDLAGVLLSMGSTHGAKGEFDRALELFEAALGIRQELLSEDPDNPDRRLEVAIALSKVGSARWSKKEPRAIEDLGQALEQTEALAKSFPRVPHYRHVLAETATLLADVLIQDGEHDAAQEALDHCVRENEKLREADPDNALYRRQWGQITYNQAWLLRDRGRLARKSGSEGWRPTIETSIEWLARSMDVWREMRERGELQPREQGHLGRIDREIGELEQELFRE